MNQYNKLNKIVGWIVFAISAFTYILTTEGSASFWDCGEFISTANKLLVGHPPGNPFFMIVGRLFAMCAPTVALVAKSVNIMSALCSAFTILFLFWTITHLAKKIFFGNGEPWRIYAIMGAGAVGALAYTFSDTFWFSAVEGEVYAMSSLFTAIVFWAILKWEDEADEPNSNRWIILIAYLMGLSIGVHLLNLLAIPAIVMVYYFKKFPINRNNTIIALLISGVLLISILYGIIPGIVKLASYFELFFVNEMGFGFNSGAIFYAILLIFLLIYGIYYTYKNNHVIANTILTAITVIIIGYSSFAMVVIRSVSNPTMDQNSPEDVFSLMDYLNREQYGDRPLFYGPSFSSPVDEENTDYHARPIRIQRNGKYEIVDYKPDYKYKANMLFPRMYSREKSHIEQYKAWTDFKGHDVTVPADDGTVPFQVVTVPTMWENLKFFFAYQCNFMYWRYFMWNFSGRQNDIQGNGEVTHGNWITGIGFIDELMVGDQSLMPDSLKYNKGHNVYFMLPFLLGLVGLFFQYSCGKEGKQGFWVVMLLFFLTGLAIVMYLNQTPLQPRERDYAYAGSFYAYTIWIGLGVLGIIEGVRQLINNPTVATVVASVVCLLFVPGVMAQQNWDDHDRSGCTIARDLAYNYLNSCDENGIIFTNGDNDTFPLWYAQEVEGIRTDVRVCNLSYLQTGWYVDQMKRWSYNSAPLPISFTHEQYNGDRDVVYLLEGKGEAIDLDLALRFVADDSDATKRLTGYEGRLCYIPARKFTFDVDSAAVFANNIVTEETYPQADKQMAINLNKSYIFKNELMILEMLRTGNWERPMYFAVTVGQENYAGLSNYFRLCGLTYQVTPFKAQNASRYETGDVDALKMYDNVMHKFVWGFYNKPGIYLDENKTRMASNLRSNMCRLAKELYAIGEKEKCVEVLDKIMYELPAPQIPHNYFSLEIASTYYMCAMNEEGIEELNDEKLIAKADKMLREYAIDDLQELAYYASLNTQQLVTVASDAQRSVAIFYAIDELLETYERDDLREELEPMFESTAARLQYLFQD